jgi:hypothetical protein
MNWTNPGLDINQKVNPLLLKYGGVITQYHFTGLQDISFYAHRDYSEFKLFNSSSVDKYLVAIFLIKPRKYPEIEFDR